MLHQMWNRFVAIMSIVTLVTLWRQMWWIIRTERQVCWRDARMRIHHFCVSAPGARFGPQL